MNQLRRIISHLPFEAFFWMGALLFLAATDPNGGAHYSLCLFKWLGLDFCPGCGLGHAVSYLFHGDIARSWQAHPLGIPAVIILGHRIYTLFKQKLSQPVSSINNHIKT